MLFCKAGQISGALTLKWDLNIKTGLYFLSDMLFCKAGQIKLYLGGDYLCPRGSLLLVNIQWRAFPHSSLLYCDSIQARTSHTTILTAVPSSPTFCLSIMLKLNPTHHLTHYHNLHPLAQDKPPAALSLTSSVLWPIRPSPHLTLTTCYLVVPPTA